METNENPQSQSIELLETLTDFTSKENWDKFFTIRGSQDSFEWYAEWPHLKQLLLSTIDVAHPEILVPGCGNSRLSEQLYDEGFHNITNIDFSKVVITDMLRRNVRDRPAMRWRIMDMTDMQFQDSSFYIVLDKGGLDALMEPECGEKLGSQYLTEVKRVLKPGGKFVCLTLAESHVLGLLFSKLRFGWKMNIHVIPQKSLEKPGLCTFMVVAEKESPKALHQIAVSFDQSSLRRNNQQVRGLFEELEKENEIRGERSCPSPASLSIENLHLGDKPNLEELLPGRRFELNLSNQNSRFSYRAVLLDARDQHKNFLYHCGVMLVPKARAHGWLYSSEEGQWTVVENAKTARLIMVFLGNRHMKTTMDEIQEDLSPLVKELAPAVESCGTRIPFMMVDDPLKGHKIVHQVSSSLTGPIIIDDVVYNNRSGDFNNNLPYGDLTFRRLIFQRNEDLVQSEAFLLKEGTTKKSSGEKEISRLSSKSRKKKDKKGSREELKICHEYLASPYHSGIISGFVLILSYLEAAASGGKTVRAAVIGLGAGVLPMFLHSCVPFVHVEAVELDPVVVTLARKYFAFTDDARLKVHTSDGIEFVKKIANSDATEGASAIQKDGEGVPLPLLEKSGDESSLESKESNRLDILIIDVDSEDISSGLSCPAAAFVEEPFLNDAKDSISDQGLFVINLVSRSTAIKEPVISRIKKVFSHIYSLQIDEDLNEVIFALKVASHTADEGTALQLQKLLTCQGPMMHTILDASKRINCLQ